MNKNFSFVVVIMLVAVAFLISCTNSSQKTYAKGTGKISISVFGEPDVLGWQISASLNLTLDGVVLSDQIYLNDLHGSVTIEDLPNTNYELFVKIEYCEDLDKNGLCSCDEIKINQFSSDSFHLADKQELEFFVFKGKNSFFLVPMDKNGFLLSTEGLAPAKTEGCTSVSVIGGAVCVDENGDGECSADEWEQLK